MTRSADSLVAMSAAEQPSRRRFLTSVAAGAGVAGLATIISASAIGAPRETGRQVQAPPRRDLIESDRQGFNRRWFAPNLQRVFVPTEADQVEGIVEEALTEFGRNVKVTSGRHCYADFVYNDATEAIIDMSALNQVGYDAEVGAFFVDAGCENWTVYRTLLNAYGRTLPAGSCYSVGAGGHISGGGYGLLSRLHGLTVDHLTAVDIVTWNARTSRATLRHVSELSTDARERDLFWAIQGAGGGNFGVIVRYYFAEPPVAPKHASITTLAWDWADMTAEKFSLLMAEYADLVEQLPRSDFTLLKLNHSSNGQFGLIMQMAAPPEMTRSEHRRRSERREAGIRRRFATLAPRVPLSRSLGGQPGFMNVPPASQEAVHLTYLEALQTLNGSGPNQFGSYKSAYMKKAFPADQVDAIYHWLQVTPPGLPPGQMSQSLLQVDSYGGAVNDRSPQSTAVPQRSSILKLQYQTYWSNDSKPGVIQTAAASDQTNGHLSWIRGMYEAVYSAYGGTPDPDKDPTGTVDGCYYNYPDLDLGSHRTGNVERALRLYFLDNLRVGRRNLVSVKATWDPENFFHHAQSIPVK